MIENKSSSHNADSETKWMTNTAKIIYTFLITLGFIQFFMILQ